MNMSHNFEIMTRAFGKRDAEDNKLLLSHVVDFLDRNEYKLVKKLSLSEIEEAYNKGFSDATRST